MSSPTLIKACKTWDKITEKLHDYGAYAEEDFSKLGCVIIGNDAEVTVGSSPGHKTHVNILTNDLMYYDLDESVNMVMKRLLEDAGLQCEVRKQEGVRCSGVNESNVENVFKQLAAPTSMDYRRTKPHQFWFPEEAKTEEEKGVASFLKDIMELGIKPEIAKPIHDECEEEGWKKYPQYRQQEIAMLTQADKTAFGEWFEACAIRKLIQKAELDLTL